MITALFCHKKKQFDPAPYFPPTDSEQWAVEGQSAWRIHRSEITSESCGTVLFIHAGDVTNVEAGIGTLRELAAAFKNREPYEWLLVTTRPGRGKYNVKQGHPVFYWDTVALVFAFLAKNGRIPDDAEIVDQCGAFDVLPAMSILCQGYLGVWVATEEARPDQESPSGMALKSMEWQKTEEIGNTFVQTLRSRAEEVQSKEWWSILSNEEARTVVLAELEAADYSSRRCVDELLRRIESTGIPFRDAELVAKCYNGICKVVKASLL